jgi:hypothetical protein
MIEVAGSVEAQPGGRKCDTSREAELRHIGKRRDVADPYSLQDAELRASQRGSWSCDAEPLLPAADHHLSAADFFT